MISKANLLRGAIVAALATMVLSCQADDTGSETQSVGNAVRDPGAKLTRNSCGVTIDAQSFASLSLADKRKLQRIKASSDAEKFEATGALIAVPKPLHTMFFAADGELIVTDDLAKACGAGALSAAETKFATEGLGETAGCWDTSAGKLVVGIKRSELRHGLVRLLGYIYTQFFTKQIGNTDNLPEELKAQVKSGLRRYKEQRDLIWDALLKDLGNTKPAAASRLAQAEQQDPEGVRNTMMGDVVDSGYCSSGTHAELETLFPNTFCAFFDGPSAMGKDLGQPFHNRKSSLDCSKL